MVVFELPGPRVVLYAGPIEFSEEMAAAASKGGDAIYGWMTEVVTASFVSRYVDGEEVWSVESGVDQDPEVITRGELPPSFAEYRRVAEEEDWTFEVPYKLSAEFGNFRPDMHLFEPIGEMRLIERTDFFDEVLKQETKRAAKEARRAAQAEKGGLLTRLFGRK
jgi:hypothetical protein